MLQDGNILSWRFNVATKCFDLQHFLRVTPAVTIVVGATGLYLGFMDHL